MNIWPHARIPFLPGLLAVAVLLAASAALVLFIASNSWDRTISVVQGLCSRADDPHTVSITGSDGIARMCLTGMEMKPLALELSRDGSRLAFALPTGRTPPPAGGPDAYLRYMRESVWYVMDINSQTLHRFPPADNNSMSLSVDGQYATVPIPCSHTSMGRCELQIFQIDTESKVCRYQVSNGYYGQGDPQCVAIRLRDGNTWNVQKESNDRACAFWQQYNQQQPFCSTR